MEPLSIRPDLSGVEPYVSPQLPAVHRMNTNESPYPPPPELMAEIAERLGETSLNRYPDRDANALLDALARRTGWSRDGIWVANGSNEVLLHLFLTFGGPQRTSLTFEPTYSLHTLIARIAGNEIVRAVRGSPDVTIDADVQERAMDGADIVLFCSPNNPTGALETERSVRLALENVPLVIVDEAYIEFAPEGSSLQPLLADHPNLVIVRTFSKAWSLAGVRLGYALANPDIVSAMATVRLPYSISTLAQITGTAALDFQTEEEERIEAIRVERRRLVQGIEAAGLTTYPSDANFVLFDTGDRHAPDPARTQDIWQGLMDKGVLVRNYASSEHLSGCLRVTAAAPEDTDAFLTALREVL